MPQRRYTSTVCIHTNTRAKQYWCQFSLLQIQRQNRAGLAVQGLWVIRFEVKHEKSPRTSQNSPIISCGHVWIRRESKTHAIQKSTKSTRWNSTLIDILTRKSKTFLVACIIYALRAKKHNKSRPQQEPIHIPTQHQPSICRKELQWAF